MDYEAKDFGKIIKKNAQSLRHDLLDEGTDCMRVYDRNLSAFPVTVDLYGRYARVTDYGEEPLDEEKKETCLDLCSRMLYLDRDKVIYTYRAKRKEGEQHEKNTVEPVITQVSENSLLFTVDLTSYADTGLFLDHAVTRQLIRERSNGCDVLNLFSYTGSFSVYAAAGGAKSVTSVDLSATYTRWAGKNLSDNGFQGSLYKCICADAGSFLDEAASENRKYDIIIFDPPAFSNSRKMENTFDVSRDWSSWIRKIASVMRKDGFILFSTNLGTFKMDKRRIRGLSVKEITGYLSAPGFTKHSKGAVRSWIMAFDDDSLSLDWSEDVKKTDKKKVQSERSGRKQYKPRREEAGRDRFDRTERSENRYGRNEYRRPERDRFDRSERPANNRYERSERSENRYGRNEYRRPERDRFDRTERSENRYGRNEYTRPERDRFDRTERSENRYGRNEYRRPERDRFDRTECPANNRYERSERSENRYGRNEYKRPAQKREGRERPYGYDSFRPARSRNDSSAFFWNDEDLDN